MNTGLDYKIETTVLFHKVQNRLFQVSELNLNRKIENRKIKLTLTTANWEKEFSLLSDNSDTFNIDLPPIESDEKCKSVLLINDQKIEKDIMLKCRRKWDVHIQNFSHTDIGYTDLPSRVIKGYEKSLKLIIEFCAGTKNLNDNCKYKWNIETGYWLENAINNFNDKEIESVKRLVRERLLEITPLYVSHTSEFNDEETLIRSLYFGFEFARECGVKIESAMATDSTGQPWILPQILYKSGIKYFSTAVNIAMAKALKLPRPFYWESLDGSKVLLFDTDERQAYQEGFMLGVNESYEAVIKKLPLYLKELEESNRYLWDLIALRNTGNGGDNSQPKIDVCYVVKEWNSRWEYPKLRISTYTDYFKEFEKKYGKILKTFSGAWPDWWVNYHGAVAFETGVNRHTHTDIIDGERLSSFLKIYKPNLYNYPKNELREIYKKTLLADGLDWTSYCSVSEPDCLQSKGQLSEEMSFVYQAAINAREVAENSRLNIPKITLSDSKYSIVITNTLNWDRSEIVQVSIPNKIFDERNDYKILDSKTGENVLSQVIEPTLHDIQSGKKRIAFKANNIPAMGFKIYDFVIEEKKNFFIGSENQKDIINNTLIQNPFYQVKYNPASGQIESIIDKSVNRELIDIGGFYKFNQLIYESTKKKRIVDLSQHDEKPEDNLYCQDYFESIHDYYHFPKKDTEFVRSSPDNQKIVFIKKGNIYTELKTSSSTGMCPNIESHILFDNCFKNIIVKNYIFKYETLDIEAIYYAFPFEFKKPEFKLNCHGGFFEPEKEQLPGSSKDTYCIQKWIDISNDEFDLVWSPIEAPLVQLSNINTGKWLDKILLKNGTILSFVMNNHWWTNTPASQCGRYCFNYRITSGFPPFDPVKANKFGWSNHIPMSANFIDWKYFKKEKRQINFKEYRLFKDIPDNVMILCLKEAEYGKEIIIRMIEISGKECDFLLAFNSAKIKSAYSVTPVEENISKIKVLNNKIKIILKPFELVSLKIEI